MLSYCRCWEPCCPAVLGPALCAGGLRIHLLAARRFDYCGPQGVEHRQSRYLNNRCENSHRPTRERERRMQRFKSPGHAQRFLSAYGPIAQHFRPRRHLLAALAYRQEMRQRFQAWRKITGTDLAA
jgi:DDE domain